MKETQKVQGVLRRPEGQGSCRGRRSQWRRWRKIPKQVSRGKVWRRKQAWSLKTTMRLAGVVVTMIAGEVAMMTVAAGVAIEVIHAAVDPESCRGPWFNAKNLRNSLEQRLLLEPSRFVVGGTVGDGISQKIVLLCFGRDVMKK